MKDMYHAGELANMLGVTRQTIIKRAKKEGWKSVLGEPGVGGRKKLFFAGSFSPAFRSAVGYRCRVEAHAWMVRQGIGVEWIAKEVGTHPFLVTRWLEGKRESRKIEQLLFNVGCPKEYLGGGHER